MGLTNENVRLKSIMPQLQRIEESRAERKPPAGSRVHEWSGHSKIKQAVIAICQLRAAIFLV